jgi:hypothetical protein
MNFQSTSQNVSIEHSAAYRYHSLSSSREVAGSASLHPEQVGSCLAYENSAFRCSARGEGAVTCDLQQARDKHRANMPLVASPSAIKGSN